jgi:hypothetical protein
VVSRPDADFENNFLLAHKQIGSAPKLKSIQPSPRLELRPEPTHPATRHVIRSARAEAGAEVV